ncbi:MAG: SHOCT domain-containing protein [Nitrospinae bacterium]|nr:SHOCT domain-containing protein [Nitrospinota bacterium]
MLKSLVLAAVLILGMSVSQGCIGIGSGPKTQQQPTVGQELMDLKAAFDRGAITEEDYNKKKAELLRKSN